MIHFARPGFLLLLIPLAIFFVRRLRSQGRQDVVRALILLLLVASLAEVSVMRRNAGVDLVVVVDRSESMPPDAAERCQELVRAVEAQRHGDHRVAVVACGGDVQLERELSARAEFGGFTRQVSASASDLAGGLKMALGLLQNKGGKILVLSDGKFTNEDPLPLAQEAALRGVQVDVRRFERLSAKDVVIESFEMPGEVIEKEPFQFAATVGSDTEQDVDVTLWRGNTRIAAGTRRLTPGHNRLVFRDILPQSGLSGYRLEVKAQDDAVPENNMAMGAVRALGAPRLLLVNATGQPDNLFNCLNAAGFPVEVKPESAARFTPAQLNSYAAVILENVPAEAIGTDGMMALAHYVEEGGGGLLVTGGKRSFGVGGYYESPLESVLPVTMEIREEHRRFNMAIAVVLDRSGSMMASVAGGKTKMDLANLGTAEVVKLLSSGDEFSAVAVDSIPHVIIPMQRVGNNQSSLMSQVKRIQSMGGGIFIYAGLEGGLHELVKSSCGTRHLVLFADAADSEEPGAYNALIGKAVAAGITFSVIGLGSEQDTDAWLLKDVAKRGGGRIYFTEDAKELPRLFAQETLTVARSSFVDEPVGGNWLAANMALLGEGFEGAFPTAGGYNLNYLKPEASLGAVTTDDYAAPLFAYWFRGLGRCATLAVEADGRFTGEFAAWDGYAGFFDTVGRWIMHEDAPEGVSVQLQSQGSEVMVQVDVDLARASELRIDAAALRLITPDSSQVETIPLTWTDEHTLTARFPVSERGTYLPVVDLGRRRLLRAAPYVQPYSPEFAPWTREVSPEEVMRRLSFLTGGEERSSVVGIFDGVVREQSMQSLVEPLAILAMLLFLLEVLFRRLALWDSVQWVGVTMAAALLRAAAWVRTRFARKRSVLIVPPKTQQSVDAADEEVSFTRSAVVSPSVPRPAPPVDSPEPAPAKDEPPRQSAFLRAKKRIDDRYGN